MTEARPAAEGDRRAELFAAERRYLFAVAYRLLGSAVAYRLLGSAVAYRLLGSAADAEDALQDAWLRFAPVGLEDIKSPRAYLVTIVTRLCLDLLRSARRRREEYVGVWLPEPAPSSELLPEELAERTESASFAFMLVMERLNPVERAVLVLHDVFDYAHAEIAEAIGRSPAASRQALRRARLKLGQAPMPPSTTERPSAHSRELVGRFLEASQSGDLDGLVSALASDVVLMSDGGGKVRAANRPLAGSEQVGRFLVAMSRMASPGTRIEVSELNGQPSVLTYEADEVTNAFLLDTSSAGITAIYVVRNPDKLRRLSGATAGG